MLRGHHAGVNSVQFCMNDTHIVTSSDDKTCVLWVNICSSILCYMYTFKKKTLFIAMNLIHVTAVKVLHASPYPGRINHFLTEKYHKQGSKSRLKPSNIFSFRPITGILCPTLNLIPILGLLSFYCLFPRDFKYLCSQLGLSHFLQKIIVNFHDC